MTAGYPKTAEGAAKSRSIVADSGRQGLILLQICLKAEEGQVEPREPQGNQGIPCPGYG